MTMAGEVGAAPLVLRVGQDVLSRLYKSLDRIKGKRPAWTGVVISALTLTMR